MENERQLEAGRNRAVPIIGLVAGIVFLALGAAALFAGGGPIVAAILLAGGVLTLVAAIVTLVRS